MLHDNNDVQDLTKRLKHVSQRLEAIVESANRANVKVLDQLNQRMVLRSVATIESLCSELELRLARLQEMRRSA